MLFRRNSQGGRGSDCLLRECFDCWELKGSVDKVECLWVRIRGRLTKETPWWEYVTDHPTRMKRQMNYSTSNCFVIASPFSCGRLAGCLLEARCSREKAV